MAEDERSPPPFTTTDYWMQGFGEGATPFVPDPPETPSPQTYRDVYRTVLRNYEHRCALTGRSFVPVEGMQPELQVTPIRQTGRLDDLHTSNFIALSSEADRAFVLGHLTLGPELRIIVDMATIDPELLEGLNASGKLHLPSGNPPDPEALRWHREVVFASTPLGS